MHPSGPAQQMSRGRWGGGGGGGRDGGGGCGEGGGVAGRKLAGSD